MKLEDVVAHLDALLRIPELPDYPTALNGLQVEGSRPVRRIACAVDAAEATIRAPPSAAARMAARTC